MISSLGQAPITHPDVQDFERYEFKYLLSETQANQLNQEIRQFMQYDGFNDGDNDEQYYVRSLYFDTPYFNKYYEKIDGVKSRIKYRLRTYSSSPDSKVPIFLEEKGRDNNRVSKQRTQISFEDLSRLSSIDSMLDLKAIHPKNPVINNFMLSQIKKRELPVVNISYFRRAYVSDFDMNFRVTFDRNVKAAPAQGLFSTHDKSFYSCVAGYTILEVKFSRRIPFWFLKLIQSYQLKRLSISKYCLGIDATGLATNLS